MSIYRFVIRKDDPCPPVPTSPLEQRFSQLLSTRSYAARTFARTFGKRRRVLLRSQALPACSGRLVVLLYFFLGVEKGTGARRGKLFPPLRSPQAPEPFHHILSNSTSNLLAVSGHPFTSHRCIAASLQAASTTGAHTHARARALALLVPQPFLISLLFSGRLSFLSSLSHTHHLAALIRSTPYLGCAHPVSCVSCAVRSTQSAVRSRQAAKAVRVTVHGLRSTDYGLPYLHLLALYQVAT